MGVPGRRDRSNGQGQPKRVISEKNASYIRPAGPAIQKSFLKSFGQSMVYCRLRIGCNVETTTRLHRRLSCLRRAAAWSGYGRKPAAQLTRSASLLMAQSGIASVYSLSSGSRTANGERLNPNALTAAHRTLAFGTKVRVLHDRSGHSVVVTIMIAVHSVALA